MKAAIKPTFFSNLSEVVTREKINRVTDEERSLYTLSQSSGWQILSGFIDGLIRNLDSVQAQAIASGANFEEIGKNAVVINMSKEVIRRIQAKVSDAKEACEKLNE